MLEERTIDMIKKAMFCMTRQCWEQGIFAQAMLEIQDYENLALAAHDIVLRQSEDGRLCNVENTPAVTDSSFCIPAILAVADREGKEEYDQAALKNIQFLLKDAPRSKDGTLFHMSGSKEVWADSAAFTPYAIALGGFYIEAYEQMMRILQKLYVPEKKLYNHVWDENKKVCRRSVAWGIGNGWILTGLLRLFLCLPNTFVSEKEKLKECFLELLVSKKNLN